MQHSVGTNLYQIMQIILRLHRILIWTQILNWEYKKYMLSIVMHMCLISLIILFTGIFVFYIIYTNTILIIFLIDWNYVINTKIKKMKILFVKLYMFSYLNISAFLSWKDFCLADINLFFCWEVLRAAGLRL